MATLHLAGHSFVQATPVSPESSWSDGSTGIAQNCVRGGLVTGRSCFPEGCRWMGGASAEPGLSLACPRRREQCQRSRGSTERPPVRACTPRENEVTRRLTAVLVLGVLLGAQAAPLAASPGRCAMKHPVPARVCCDLSGHPDREGSISAGSCCRFEAATPRTTAPGIVPSPAPSRDGVSLPASLALSRLEDPAPARSGSDLPQVRSTRSPLSLHNTLRL